MTAAESFGSSELARFINSSTGRVLRIVVSLVVVGLAYTMRVHTSGIVLIVVGPVPLGPVQPALGYRGATQRHDNERPTGRRTTRAQRLAAT